MLTILCRLNEEKEKHRVVAADYDKALKSLRKTEEQLRTVSVWFSTWEA